MITNKNNNALGEHCKTQKNIMSDNNEKIQPQPKILELAENIASDLIDLFKPHEQNEAIKQVIFIIKANRLRMIDEAEKNAEYLKQTLQEI